MTRTERAVVAIGRAVHGAASVMLALLGVVAMSALGAFITLCLIGTWITVFS